MTFMIGLTGSISTGKSVVVRFWRDQGVPVFSADEAVASLYNGEGEACKTRAALETAFPGSVTSQGKVNRAILQKYLDEDNIGFTILEAIVHPFVRTMEDNFRTSQAVKQAGIGACEIPLLFETHSEKRFDSIVVTTTHPSLQRQWVLERPNMTEAHFEQLNARQIDNSIKCARAHFIIDTSLSYDATYTQSRDILRALSSVRAGRGN
jgi:dephospho-CoA kinase